MTVTGLVEGYVEIKIGEQVSLSIDILDKNGQTFTISSGTVSVYDADDVVTAVSGDSITPATGLNGSQRAQRMITDSETNSFTAGPHYAIWTLTLSDSQIRILKQNIDVVAVP